MARSGRQPLRKGSYGVDNGFGNDSTVCVGAEATTTTMTTTTTTTTTTTMTTMTTITKKKKSKKKKKKKDDNEEDGLCERLHSQRRFHVCAAVALAVAATSSATGTLLSPRATFVAFQPRRPQVTAVRKVPASSLSFSLSSSLSLSCSWTSSLRSTRAPKFCSRRRSGSGATLSLLRLDGRKDVVAVDDDEGNGGGDDHGEGGVADGREYRGPVLTAASLSAAATISPPPPLPSQQQHHHQYHHHRRHQQQQQRRHGQPSVSRHPPSSTMIVVDVENVRGASSFRLSHESLLRRAALWRSSRTASNDLCRSYVGGGGGQASSSSTTLETPTAEGIAMIFDHGSARTAHALGPLPVGIAAIFAGPRRTADDVIVSLVGERCGWGGIGYDDVVDDHVETVNGHGDDDDHDDHVENDNGNGDNYKDDKTEREEIYECVDVRGGGGANNLAHASDSKNRPKDGVVASFSTPVIITADNAAVTTTNTMTTTTMTHNYTFVVTADARLISRCQRAKRTAPARPEILTEEFTSTAALESTRHSLHPYSTTIASLSFVEPASFLRELDAHASQNEEEEFWSNVGNVRFGQGAIDNVNDDGDNNDDDDDDNDNDEYNDGSEADACNDANNVAIGVNDRRDHCIDDNDAEADLAFVKKEDADLALIRTVEWQRRLALDMNHKIGPPKKGTRQGRRNGDKIKGGTKNGKRRDGVVSARRRNKLLTQKHRAAKKAEMAEAYRKRQVQAENLRRKLCVASGVVSSDRAPIFRMLQWLSAPSTTVASETGSGLAAMPSLPLLTYSAGEDAAPGGGGGGGGVRAAGGEGAVCCPLSSVLTVPLRENDGIMSGGAIERECEETPLASAKKAPLSSSLPSAAARPPPLRIVVISDTHGFERSLSNLPSPSSYRLSCDRTNGDDDGESKGDGLGFGIKVNPFPSYTDANANANESTYKVHPSLLLPQADVLIHCGDFAANGSRARQRESIRHLDSFLAAQRHIAEKIVIKGNHDPDTPGKVLFPKSKALYATSSLTLVVNGVRFALEPYSRRRALSSSYFYHAHSYGGVGVGAAAAAAAAPHIPECDVLVSHEPPRDVLDLTYRGVRAGSVYLRRAVERSVTKPRCWLCGHIHEGRGAAKEVFVRGNSNADADDVAAVGGRAQATLVVNAANANRGKATRLVAGVVVIDVEREAATFAAAGGNGDFSFDGPRMRRSDEQGDSSDGSALTCVALRDGPSSEPSLVVVDDVGDSGGLGLELREMRPGVRRRRGMNVARSKRRLKKD